MTTTPAGAILFMIGLFAAMVGVPYLALRQKRQSSALIEERENNELQ
jgi:hypothetical protein